MPSSDVVVVGAGPAGVAAAVTLARAGRAVALVDKARFPRDKICGDGLTAGALRLLEGLGLDPGAVASWQRVADVVVRGPSGHEVTFPLPRGQGTYAAVARRADLDDALVDLARTAGVEVLDGHACSEAAQDGDRVVVGVDGVGEIEAGFAVAADGMWSPVRKHLGLATPGYRGEWHAFRQYFDGVGPRAARDLFVWFEPDLLPGYALVVPAARRNGPTSASASSGAARWPASRRWRPSGPTCWPGRTCGPCWAREPGPSRPTGPGPSRPASTAPCWPRDARCSWATPPWPPTRSPARASPRRSSPACWRPTPSSRAARRRRP